MQGDCLERMKEIPSGSVDMILTDPPYGTTACKWDSIIPLEPMWEQLKRIIKPNGAIVMTASQPFTAALVMSNPKMFRCEWVWDKVTASGFQIAKHTPMKRHESILVFSKSKVNYIPIMEKMEKPDSYKCYTKSESSPLAKNDGEKRFRTHKYPKTIITVSNANKKGGLHPTQKPVALMEYLIKTYTNEGETVLDFTMGSGTTGVACVNLNRNFIGIELDEGYFKIAEERIQKAKERQND
jgi:site-specific DNA-methyltransferase (adenine-specific)